MADLIIVDGVELRVGDVLIYEGSEFNVLGLHQDGDGKDVPYGVKTDKPDGHTYGWFSDMKNAGRYGIKLKPRPGQPPPVQPGANRIHRYNPIVGVDLEEDLNEPPPSPPAEPEPKKAKAPSAGGGQPDKGKDKGQPQKGEGQGKGEGKGEGKGDGKDKGKDPSQGQGEGQGDPAKGKPRTEAARTKARQETQCGGDGGGPLTFEYDDGEGLNGITAVKVHDIPLDADPVKCKYAEKYQALKRQFAGHIQALRQRVILQNEDPQMHLRHQRRGELDIDALGEVKLGLRTDDVFSKKYKKDRPKIAVCLLLDNSGSMAGTRSHIVRALSCIFYEAFKGLHGLELAIMAHTTGSARIVGDKSMGDRDEPGMDDVCNPIHGTKVHSDFFDGATIPSGTKYGSQWYVYQRDGLVVNDAVLLHVHTPYHSRIENLMSIEGRGGNIDGFPMAATAKHMLQWYPDHNRFVLVLSDGQPCPAVPSGEDPRKTMQQAVKKAERQGTHILGVGLDRPFSQADGDLMYGPGRHVILDRSLQSIPYLANWMSAKIRELNMKAVKI